MESLPPLAPDSYPDCARDPVLLPSVSPAGRGAANGPSEAESGVEKAHGIEVIEASPEVMAREAVETAGVLRRIRWISAVAWGLFSAITLISSGFAALVGLTCSALVVMINFLWLEEIVSSVLRPDPHLHPWRLTLRTLGRFALLGAAISVTIFVARFNALSVLLGFSIVVVGIVGEALYSTYRSFAG